MSDVVTTTLDSATTNLQTELVGAAAIGVGVGATLFAITKGWKKLRGNI